MAPATGQAEAGTNEKNEQEREEKTRHAARLEDDHGDAAGERARRGRVDGALAPLGRHDLEDAEARRLRGRDLEHSRREAMVDASEALRVGVGVGVGFFLSSAPPIGVWVGLVCFVVRAARPRANQLAKNTRVMSPNRRRPAPKGRGRPLRSRASFTARSARPADTCRASHTQGACAICGRALAVRSRSHVRNRTNHNIARARTSSLTIVVTPWKKPLKRGVADLNWSSISLICRAAPGDVARGAAAGGVEASRTRGTSERIGPAAGAAMEMCVCFIRSRPPRPPQGDARCLGCVAAAPPRWRHTFV